MTSGKDFLSFYHKLFCLGFMISGGHGSYGDSEAKSSVELVDIHTGSSCMLKNLPQNRWEHTQVKWNSSDGENFLISQTGQFICGGLYESQARLSCLEMRTNGEWATSHSFTSERWAHTSWSTGGGILLVGGHESPNTTELASIDGSSQSKFNLKENSM